MSTEFTEQHLEAELAEASGLEDGYDEFSATDALMEKWTDDEEEDGASPSNSAEQSDGEQQDETPANDEESDGSDAKEGEAGEDDDDTDGEDTDGDETQGEDNGTLEILDTAKITVKVNGEVKEFAVGDLKRLAGQEAALTQKSQAVAANATRYQDGLNTQSQAMAAMLKRATDRFAPYKEIDFALAAQQYDADTYHALKAEATEAYSDLQFLTNGMEQVATAQKEETERVMTEQANSAVAALRDPTTGIPGFNKELFADIRTFAVDKGLNANTVDNLTDPAAWKIIHMAMMASKAQGVKDAAPAPVKGKVRKVIKQSRSESSKASAKARKAAAERKRARDADVGGLDSIDQAAEALMARWSD